MTLDSAGPSGDKVWRWARKVALLAVVLWLVGGEAVASHSNHFVRHHCNHNSAPYFWLGGPASGWNLSTSGGNAVDNCGHFWTFTTTGSTVNSASWYLPVSSSYNGDYYVDAYKANGTNFRANARYQRLRNGSGSGVTETYRVNQSSFSTGAWMRVTKFGDGSGYDHFNGSNGGYMRVLDSTGQSSVRMGVDAMQYIVRHRSSGGGGGWGC